MINFGLLTSVEYGAHNIAKILCTKYVNEIGCSLLSSNTDDDIKTVKDITHFYDISYNEALVKLTNYKD